MNIYTENKVATQTFLTDLIIPTVCISKREKEADLPKVFKQKKSTPIATEV